MSAEVGTAEQLADHLAARYGVTVERLVALDEGVYRVDGPGWVARWFPAGADAAVATQAALLDRLAPTPFPAERLATAEPVSGCAGRPVLVTEFAAGRTAPSTPRMFAALGACLGGLHARAGDRLPLGGGWHHLVAQGTPAQEIAAAITLLESAGVDRAARQTLIDELREQDDGADLPHGIVHPDFVPANVILQPGHGMVVVDWAGSGRGPRVRSLGFLLWAAGARDLSLVDATMSRYREQVELTDEEWARMPDAIRARPLTLDCWSVGHGRLDAATAVRRLDDRIDLSEAIAERAHRAIQT